MKPAQAPQQERFSGGGGQEEAAADSEMVHTPEKPAAQLSSQSTHAPGSSGKRQYSLLKFLGSLKQKAAAKPSLSGAKPELQEVSESKVPARS